MNLASIFLVGIFAVTHAVTTINGSKNDKQGDNTVTTPTISETSNSIDVQENQRSRLNSEAKQSIISSIGNDQQSSQTQNRPQFQSLDPHAKSSPLRRNTIRDQPQRNVLTYSTTPSVSPVIVPFQQQTRHGSVRNSASQQKQMNNQQNLYQQQFFDEQHQNQFGYAKQQEPYQVQNNNDRQQTPSQHQYSPDQQTPFQLNYSSDQQTPSQLNYSPDQQTPSQLNYSPDHQTPSQLNYSPDQQTPSQHQYSPDQQTPSRHQYSPNEKTSQLHYSPDQHTPSQQLFIVRQIVPAQQFIYNTREQSHGQQKHLYRQPSPNHQQHIYDASQQFPNSPIEVNARHLLDEQQVYYSQPTEDMKRQGYQVFQQFHVPQKLYSTLQDSQDHQQTLYYARQKSSGPQKNLYLNRQQPYGENIQHYNSKQETEDQHILNYNADQQPQQFNHAGQQPQENQQQIYNDMQQSQDQRYIYNSMHQQSNENQRQIYNSIQPTQDKQNLYSIIQQSQDQQHIYNAMNQQSNDNRNQPSNANQDSRNNAMPQTQDQQLFNTMQKFHGPQNQQYNRRQQSEEQQEQLNNKQYSQEQYNTMRRSSNQQNHLTKYNSPYPEQLLNSTTNQPYEQFTTTMIPFEDINNQHTSDGVSVEQQQDSSERPLLLNKDELAPIGPEDLRNAQVSAMDNHQDSQRSSTFNSASAPVSGQINNPQNTDMINKDGAPISSTHVAPNRPDGSSNRKSASLSHHLKTPYAWYEYTHTL